MGSARRVQKLQQQQRFHRVDANGSKTYLYLLIYLLFPIASADPATSPWNIDFATTVGLDGEYQWPPSNVISDILQDHGMPLCRLFHGLYR